MNKAFFLSLIFYALFAAFPGIAEERKSAEFRVRGYGFWGNMKLKQHLKLLQPEDQKLPFLTPNLVEDAVLLLMSQLNQDGYLKPKMTARLISSEGNVVELDWDDQLQTTVPRPAQYIDVHFQIHPGTLYYFENLIFQNPNVISEDQARSFFMDTNILFRTKRARIYTPQRLRKGVSSLLETLNRKGYQDASANAGDLHVNDLTGAVSATIDVNPGKLFIVSSLRQEICETTNSAPLKVDLLHPNVSYSRLWTQDFSQNIRTQYFSEGYPDAEVIFTETGRNEDGNRVLLDLSARVILHSKIRVGEIKLKGLRRTKSSIVNRLIPLATGDALNRLEAENSRVKLSRLGVFESVQLHYEPINPQIRDVVYEFQEGRQLELFLLAGYGSYEQLRGGFEFQQHNLWGRAHETRLKTIQSFKSTRGDFSYFVPSLFGEELDGFMDGFALNRQEPSFLRREYGAGIGARRYIPDIDSHMSLRYKYELLSATDTSFEHQQGLSEANVSAIEWNIRHDQTDNPLYPNNGYNLFSYTEGATEYLGGEVNYYRMEVEASFHRELDGGRILHLGLSHGLVLVPGDPDEDLPFNKRFFPGGDHSIRGYPYGEASPRNREGDIVGAESYLLGHIELEQSITKTWAIVFFFDALGISRKVESYPPIDESLFSLGTGLRWKTLIGPVRLEYGHNLSPRKEDPAGTLHLTIGFPF